MVLGQCISMRAMDGRPLRSGGRADSLVRVSLEGRAALGAKADEAVAAVGREGSYVIAPHPRPRMHGYAVACTRPMHTARDGRRALNLGHRRSPPAAALPLSNQRARGFRLSDAALPDPSQGKIAGASKARDDEEREMRAFRDPRGPCGRVLPCLRAIAG